MEQKLRYNPPTGDPMGNPPLNLIQDIVLRYDAEYWGEDTTGGCMLDFYNVDVNKFTGGLSLFFFFEEAFGFFLYYNLEFVPVKKGTELRDDIVVEHIVGTEPMRVPSICIRGREEALQIIMDFIEHKKMSEDYNWVRLGDIDYDRGAF